MPLLSSLSAVYTNCVSMTKTVADLEKKKNRKKVSGHIVELSILWNKGRAAS